VIGQKKYPTSYKYNPLIRMMVDEVREKGVRPLLFHSPLKSPLALCQRRIKSEKRAIHQHSEKDECFPYEIVRDR
jgi:hypothetical protein